MELLQKTGNEVIVKMSVRELRNMYLAGACWQDMLTAPPSDAERARLLARADDLMRGADGILQGIGED